MQEGKPAYTQEDLSRITAGMLRDRPGKIDNRQAHEIALKLWKAVEKQYTNQYGQLMLKDNHSLLRMAGRMTGRRLVERLNQLRHVDLGDIIAEGPARMEMATASLHPFVRMLQPPLPLKETTDSAAYLLRYIEFYENPEQAVPESFRRSWLFVAGMAVFMVLPMLLLVANIELVKEQKWLLVPFFILMVAGILLSTIQLAGFGRIRTISLYISFTDEFVGTSDPAEQD